MASYIMDFIASIAIMTLLLTSSIVIVSQYLNRAEIYQQDQQIFLKASDILNNLVQNTGYPQDWGQTNETPTNFGLGMPFTEYVSPSPFTLMRLMKANETISYSNIEYRNLTTESTHLFLRSDEYLNYSDAAKLLAIERDFGFSISIEPVLKVSISQLQADPLKIRIITEGLSGSVAGATLNASLLYVKNGLVYPSVSNPISKHTTSNISGSAEIEFPAINASVTPYIVLVKASTGGTYGVGYHTNTCSPDSPVLPIITDYSEGEVSIVHRKNITATYWYSGDVYYNLTFINQIGQTDFQSITLEASSGIVTLSKPGAANLSIGNTGILLVSSNAAGSHGLTVMPWGITPLCISMRYGADPMNKKTVVKTSQFVTVNGLSYKLEVALWRFAADY